MNILITGANGFVGKALVNELSKSKDKLFLVSREKFSFKTSTTLVGDLLDISFCKKIIADMDTVYYLAGYKKNIAFHTKNPNEFVLGNIEPLITFLKAVKNSSVKKIIYLSSTNVGLYKEGETDGYVVGKYINELILKAFAKETGIDVKIVRSTNVYGPGDNFNPETANFIPSIINKVYSGDSQIVVWGKGTREMQFVYVDDLVSNLVQIEKSQESFFQIGNSEVLSVNQIVEKIIKISGKNVELKNDSSKPDKASQLFDFNNVATPKFSMENGLIKTLEYYKKQYA